MDTHTLELLDFDKVRALVAARAACSLGKPRPHTIEPERRSRRDSRPAGADDRDGRSTRRGLEAPVRRTARYSPSRAASRRREACSRPEELAETVETLRAIGNLDDWLARVGDQFPRLGGLRQERGRVLGRRRRHRGMPRQSGQGARYSQPPALRACGATSAAPRNESRRR